MAWLAGAVIAGGFHANPTPARRALHPAQEFGDPATFSIALILAIVVVEIAEGRGRPFKPRPNAFARAIPVAVQGLVATLASAWLLARGGQCHHGAAHAHEEAESLFIGGRALRLAICEDGASPRRPV